MVIIRGTRKFLDRVGRAREPDAASTTTLGDWFSTVLFWRPQVALFVNATTLLPVFTPFAPAVTVVGRLPDALAVVLQAHGAPGSITDREVAAAADQVPAKTNSRSVVGVMNEFVRLAEWRRDEITEPDDLIRLSLELAEPHAGRSTDATSAPTANSRPRSPDSPVSRRPCYSSIALDHPSTGLPNRSSRSIRRRLWAGNSPFPPTAPPLSRRAQRVMSPCRDAAMRHTRRAWGLG